MKVERKITTLVLMKDQLRWEQNGLLKDVFKRSGSTRMLLDPEIAINNYPNGTIFSVPFLRRLERITAQYSDPYSRSLITNAYLFALEVHHDQRRTSSGELYIVHPLAVAKALADLGCAADTVAAALLHDTIEDGKGKVTGELLQAKFGRRTAEMVEDVTELGKEPGANTGKPALIEIFKKMASARHLSSLIIKLFDRRDNLMTLDYLKKPAKQKEKADETLDFHVRIADILGMWQIRRELEELAFPFSDPQRCQEISEKRKQVIEESSAKIDEIVQKIYRKLLEAGLNIDWI